jgi:hypothetical protein
VSDESGRREIYVRQFRSDGDVPAVGPAITVSTGGGNEPRWRRDGHVLYYVAPDRHVMTVSLNGRSTFFDRRPTQRTVRLDSSPGGPSPPAFAYYDVATDAPALIVSRLIAATAAPITVVTGWMPRATSK